MNAKRSVGRPKTKQNTGVLTAKIDSDLKDKFQIKVISTEPEKNMSLIIEKLVAMYVCGQIKINA